MTPTFPILAKVQFGSKLYGTAIETSDDDYRAIYLPPIDQCVLGRVKDAWEDKGEEDTSFFSLQHFCRMAVEGQSVAIELLAAPPSAVVMTNPVWQRLQANRHRFYTRSMHSFLGYAKTMAGKYSSRIDRLHETEAVLAVLQRHYDMDSERFRRERGVVPGSMRLSEVWDTLPESLNVQKTTNERGPGTDKRVYRVCGRELQATVTIVHAQTVVKGIHDSYGERVRKAAAGQIEWKALAHAFRAALQCREIVTTGDLRFPLADATWLRDLRLGRFDFVQCGLDKRLDDLIAEVQALMDASSLPAQADAAWADNLVLEAYGLTGGESC